jgi:NADH-quinone oxidoreductase subunit F
MSKRVEAGGGWSADLDILVELGGNFGMMPGLSICGLSDGAAFPIRTIVEKFRDELEEKVRSRDEEPGNVPVAAAE